MPKNLETLLHSANRLGVTHECDGRTDAQMDRSIIANAALNCVARSKTIGVNIEAEQSVHANAYY